MTSTSNTREGASAHHKTEGEPPPPERSGMSKIVVGTLAVLSGIYLLNPTFGVFEIIPDNLPVFGNLDEATAALFIFYALRYFGIDVLGFVKSPEDIKNAVQGFRDRNEGNANGRDKDKDVIDV